MPVLEREEELAAVDRAARDARRGAGAVIVIEGPAGVGKTAVLQQARLDLGADLVPLGARGGLLEREFPFGVARQLLEHVTADREIPDAARAALAAPGTDGAPGGGGFAILHALLRTVQDLADERPLLITVDDLQWADTPSLRFVAYLARRIESLPVLLVATVRTGEPDVDDDLLDAVREAPSSVITPAPLSAAAVGAVLGEQLGADADPSFVEAACTATGGNPLLVRELGSALATEGVAPVAARADVIRSTGARAVSRTVASRLMRMDATAIATARAFAVLGDGASVADAARFAELDEAAVAAATGPLARADILRADPPIGFVHPLVAEAVLQTLAPGERELLHAQAARIMHAAGADSEVVAGHLLRGTRRGEAWAVEILRAAASRAMRRGAPENAAALLQRALDEPPPAPERSGLLLELGLAEAVSGRPGAVEHLRGALATLVEPYGRAAAAAVLGRVLVLTGEPEAGAGVAREVAAEMGPDMDDMREQLEAFAIMSTVFGDDSPTAGPATVAFRDRIPQLGAGPGAFMIAGVTALAWANEGPPLDGCVALARAALAGDALFQTDPGFLLFGPIVPLIYAEHPDAMAALDRALAQAQTHGSLMAIAATRMWRAYVHCLRGELATAVEEGRRAAGDADLWGFDVNYVAAVRGMAHAGRGELARARRILDASPPRPTRSAMARLWHEAHLMTLVAERRDEEALAIGALMEERFDHVRNPTTATWRLQRALVRHRTGDTAGALADLDLQLELARRWGAPGAIGSALRVRGELLGDDDVLAEAVATLERSTMRLELARALLAQGRRARLDRRPTDARDPLRRSLEIAAECGVSGLVEELRTELAAAGVRPRVEALSGPGSLTASERRVAELAADGLTNREIAAQLFVTPKTVEVHLGASYRKLGIRSRRGLAEALRPHDT